MKVFLLKVIGLIQFSFLVFFNISYVNLHNGSILTQLYCNSYNTLYCYDLFEMIYFLICAIILFAVIYAFYSDLKKSIILIIFGAALDIFPKILPFIFLWNWIYLRYSLNLFLTPSIFISIIIVMHALKTFSSSKEEAKIRRYILEIGTVHPDFKLSEVSKMCKVDKSKIVTVVKSMIKNGEIYADYFKLARKFIFNNKANLEEIDKLMKLYNEWEEKTIGKQI